MTDKTETTIESLLTPRVDIDALAEETRLKLLSEKMPFVAWDIIKDALQKAAQGQQWLPIESAPKDGTRLLGTRKGSKCIHTIFWGKYFNREFWRGWPQQEGNGAPTHWQPIPAPPATKEK